jgi:hypothetical protein
VNKGKCQAIDEVKITVLPLKATQTVRADAGKDRNICLGESVELTVKGGSSYLWNTGETTQSILVSPLKTTVYSVTVDDGSSSDSDEVTVFVQEVKADAGKNKRIIKGESVKLMASGGDEYLWSTGEKTRNIRVDPLETTIYSVLVFRNGCEDSDSVQVTVEEPEPETNSIEIYTKDEIAICLGEELSLKASPGQTYEWNTGDTGQEVLVKPLRTSQYSVRIWNNGIESIENIIVQVKNCEEDGNQEEFLNDKDIVKEEQSHLELELNIYPNPSQGILNYSIDGAESDLVLHIYDVNGRLVYDLNESLKFGRITNSLNLSSLSKGVYFFKIYNSGESLVRKFILV